MALVSDVLRQIFSSLHTCDAQGCRHRMHERRAVPNHLWWALSLPRLLRYRDQYTKAPHFFLSDEHQVNVVVMISSNFIQYAVSDVSGVDELCGECLANEAEHFAMAKDRQQLQNSVVPPVLCRPWRNCSC